MSTGSKRVFWLCFGVSLALHLVVLAELPGFALRSEPEPPALQARLVAPEPPPVPVMPPEKPRVAVQRETAKPKPRPPAPAQGPQAVVAAAGDGEAPLPHPPPGPAWADEEPLSAPVAAETETPAAEVAPAPETPEVAAAEAGAPQKAEEEVRAKQMRQSGSIRYEVYYGSDRFSVGRSEQTWSIDESSYRLTSFSETTGLVGLFKPYQYAYVTEGRVEPEGLRPEFFSVRRGRGGERQASARFDWDNRRLTYGARGSQRSAPLNGRSYDLLTLFYQLARMPLEPGLLEFSVTTGTKYNRYILEIGTEESLELPVGTLRAIPVKQVHTPGEESMEVWLAPEQQYLPVLIRFYDREGKLSAEQVATQIVMDTLAADVR